MIFGFCFEKGNKRNKRKGWAWALVLKKRKKRNKRRGKKGKEKGKKERKKGRWIGLGPLRK